MWVILAAACRLLLRPILLSTVRTGWTAVSSLGPFFYQHVRTGWTGWIKSGPWAGQKLNRPTYCTSCILEVEYVVAQVRVLSIILRRLLENS